MTVWDLSRLRYTVRKLTGKFDETQLPSTSPNAGQVSVSNPPGVDDYINDFYLLDFPEHLRTLKLDNFYTFTTLPNVGTYNVPQSIQMLSPPAYVDNYQSGWHESPNQFYNIWPEFNFIDAAISQGNGGMTYTFQLTQGPVQQGSVVIGNSPNLDGTPSPQQETFVDQDYPCLLDQPLQEQFTNPGTLTGNLGGTGTVDYLTGIVSITYANPLSAGVNINAHYHPYVASRPRDILFYQQQLFIRPIPNDTYLIKLIAYVQPTVAISQLSNATQKVMFDGTLTDVPLWNEWWQLLAYGAAMKLLIEENDWEEVGNLKPIFEEQKLLAQRRALKELANKRMPTRYAENMDGQGGYGWPIFPYY